MFQHKMYFSWQFKYYTPGLRRVFTVFQIYLSIPELIFSLSVSQNFAERSFILVRYYLLAKVPVLSKGFY